MLCRRLIWPAIAVAIAFGLAACSGPDRDAPNIGSSAGTNTVAQLPGWQDDALDGWRRAWLRSCSKRPWKKALAVDRAAWRDLCAETVPENPSSLRAWIEQSFQTVRLDKPAHATGYFKPHYQGSLRPTPAFSTPLYRPPPDLAQRRSRLSRTAIDNGALVGEGLELIWLDRIDAFFLHIQGSGVITVPGQAPLRIVFAGHNGQQYRAIGRDLINQGAITKDAISMQSISAWLRLNPALAPEMMQRNPRYIFFRQIQGEGPIGAAGVALTATRSVAVDPKHLPYGAVLWLDLEATPGTNHPRLRRLTMAQDTGAAIKGEGRIDYFWGGGPQAGELAGRMNAQGRLYILKPRASR
jgi:membrane-bound lytic murein transglycosylase A